MKRDLVAGIAVAALACSLVGCASSGLNVSGCSEYVSEPASVSEAAEDAAMVVRATKIDTEDRSRFEVEITDEIKPQGLERTGDRITVDLACAGQYSAAFEATDLLLLLNPLDSESPFDTDLFYPAVPRFAVVSFTPDSFDELVAAVGAD